VTSDLVAHSLKRMGHMSGCSKKSGHRLLSVSMMLLIDSCVVILAVLGVLQRGF
jgi:hypothetical protein